MRVVRVTQYGESEVLKLMEVDEPKPQLGQALVRIHYAGVNFIDVAMRRGWFPDPPVSPPFTPGTEGAGEVVALGDGVSEVKVGDRVSFMQDEKPGLDRAYADFIAIKSWKLITLPDRISYELAAAMTAQGMTTHYMMNEICHVGTGRTVLIHAAAGGMGLNLVQWAKHLGARVIGTCSPSKASHVLELGADDVIDYTNEDFVVRVKELTGGRGADLIIDGIGKTTFNGDLEAVATRGHIVCYGITSGAPDAVSPLTLLTRSRSIHGADLFDYISNAQERKMRANAVWQALAEGWLKPQISATYSLEEAAKAQDKVVDRSNVGKVLIKIAD